MIQHKNNLLDQIAEGLKRFDNVKVGCIKVTFVVDNEEYDFGLQRALDVLANDLYFDERGNWSLATEARVESY